ncbi:MAG: hypothetical protein AAGI48_03685 [Verrucomicrobiota bacterium]
MKLALHSAIVLSLLPLHAYELHEWGTFTTVSGSDGQLLIGLQREEEALPNYVRHHPGFKHVAPAFGQLHPVPAFPIFTKRAPLPVKNVKVKMETPVIYFHSEDPFTAKVKVGFKGGTIAQWYPERSGGEKFPTSSGECHPKRTHLDFAQPYDGAIEWKIDVLSREESRSTSLFNPEDILQWTYSRVPEANVVRDSKGNTEGFLFYRGLGSFDPGLITRISEDETLHLENLTGGEIPYTLVYERQPDGSTRWIEAGSIAEGQTLSTRQSQLEARPKGFDRELFTILSENLTDQGLLASEAEAMVKTWWKSYFETPGLRVFWVLPQERTDAILPLSVEPAPEKTIRVIVGRSEVLRPSQEREWLGLANSDDKKERARWTQLVWNDRFGEAFKQRVLALQAQAKR